MLLIDDVITTGATAEACARTLEARRRRAPSTCWRSPAPWSPAAFCCRLLDIGLGFAYLKGNAAELDKKASNDNEPESCSTPRPFAAFAARPSVCSTARAPAFIEIDVSGEPCVARRDDLPRLWPAHRAADLHRRHACRRLSGTCRARARGETRSAGSRNRSRRWRLPSCNDGGANPSAWGWCSFAPAAPSNRIIETAEALIRRAAKGGAEYVQTPENTAIMELEPERLLAAVETEERSAPLAHLRGLAKELGIFLHVGSLGIKLGPAQNRQPLLSHRPGRGGGGALRQAASLRCRSCRRRELPRIRRTSSLAPRPCSPISPGAGSAFPSATI